MSDLQYNYLRGYFTAHAFSVSSYRYEFIMWFALMGVFALIALFHHSGIEDQTSIGALWNKWAVRNRVIKIGRKSNGRPTSVLGHQQSNRLVQQVKTPSRAIFTFPSFGRILLLTALVCIPVALTLVGADYIRPGAGVFDMSESWPNSSISIYTPGLSRRSLIWGQGQYPSVSIKAPTITLPYRTWWTAGSRVGAMTNALTPLIVITALKQIPFALLSTRLMGGYSFDRLNFMHKWGGRIVWLFATLHVALWAVQITQEQAFYGKMWTFIFMWTKFRWGFVSYGFFTLLILLSIGPMRANYYEIFYICHVVCIVGFMVSAWLHHPPAGYWMYITLLWWASERITRAFKVAWINGIGFTGRRPQVIMTNPEKKTGRNLSVSDSSGSTILSTHPSSHQHYRQYAKASYDVDDNNTSSDSPPLSMNRHQTNHRSQQYQAVNNISDDRSVDHESRGGIMMQSMEHKSHERYQLVDRSMLDYQHNDRNDYETGSTASSSYQGGTHRSQNPSMSTLVGSVTTHGKKNPRPAMGADVAAVIKPGFAYAQLLPGKTIRLTLRTPNSFAWSPGQYVNLCIPCVRWWQSHPFTIASAYNAGFPSSTSFQEDDVELGVPVKAKGEERTIVLLIRARRGFTFALWDYVRMQREQQIRSIEQQTGRQYIRGEVAKTATGVHLRAFIDGPFGSIQRVRWGVQSSVVIIAGGSGISSAMSILEYLCSVMAGNKKVKNFGVRRVRFVWMLREYAHLQWAASALRRCIELVPPELLQVDLYVTKIQRLHIPTSQMTTPNASSFAVNTMASSGSFGQTGHFSHDNGYEFVRFTEGADQEEFEVNVQNLTGYEGEDNTLSAAEARISERVFKEGKLRRANTRRNTTKRTLGRGGAKGSSTTTPTGVSLLPRSTSTFAHQTSVYESSRQPQIPLNRIASTIPETDLGEEDIKYDESQDQLKSDIYRRDDGFLQTVNGSRPTMNHLTTESSMASWQNGGLSPSMTPTPLQEVGRTLGDQYGSSSNLLNHGMDNASMTNLTETVPHSINSHYDGGAEVTPVISEADAPIDLDEEENADLQVLAELARPGYPKIDTIIREEAQMSSGRILVTACGPPTLGKLVQGIASKQISVSQVRKGHLNGHLSVLVESYE